MAIPLVVIGAGGFGRETLDVIEAMNRDRTEPIFELLGVVDSCPSEANIARLARRGVAYLGTETSWMDEGRHAQVLIGIGNPGLREVVAEKFGAAGFTAAIAIHPSASIGSSVTIGAGAVVCGGVQISTNVVIGNHVHVNPNVTVGHDSILRDFVSINPAAVVSGEVSIGGRAHV